LRKSRSRLSSESNRNSSWGEGKGAQYDVTGLQGPAPRKIKAHLGDECLIYVLAGRFGVDIKGDDEAEEKLQYELEVRPARLGHGIILLGIVLHVRR
jgi:hypothetical protein